VGEGEAVAEGDAVRLPVAAVGPDGLPIEGPVGADRPGTCVATPDVEPHAVKSTTAAAQSSRMPLGTGAEAQRYVISLRSGTCSWPA
jgi:hypothetical protein